MMTPPSSTVVPLLARRDADTGFAARLHGALASLKALFDRPAAPAEEHHEDLRLPRETWALGYAGCERAAYRHLRLVHKGTRI